MSRNQARRTSPSLVRQVESVGVQSAKENEGVRGQAQGFGRCLDGQGNSSVLRQPSRLGLLRVGASRIG